MNDILSIILALAPYLIIGFVLIYLFHEAMRFIKTRDEQMIKLRLATNQNTVSSGQSESVIKLELQAAERFALYLERISPDRLVMRLHQTGMSAKMLQSEMLRAIREEFDHNLSQQIYISENAWELIKNAKEEMVKFISVCGDNMGDKNSGLDLSRKIFEAASRVEKLPSEIALQYLRKETRRYLN
ncbi:hypothetical protein G3O08_02945 [Cryomorpha ignava]|uniref:Uncharacterized protein n=1 Tax=Cryomorpha ignava TaxID=101383 RepID=A0A7K3WLS4_9FLAO|nr:hypothetical protein [Cryomorpha ignava]NEN22458.1 hypothetical protein [Cryomorpha ignava]